MIENIFTPGAIELTYTHYDRKLVGGAMPTDGSVALPCPDGPKANYFLERRELGTLNVGGPGAIVVDSTTYELGTQACLYVGRGSQQVNFESADAANPAKFYLLPAPAHSAGYRAHPHDV